MEYSESEKDRYHYYVHKSNLNGLANLMYKNHNIKPTAMTGTIASIHRLSYGNLRIYSDKTEPPNPEFLKSYEDIRIIMIGFMRTIPMRRKRMELYP